MREREHGGEIACGLAVGLHRFAQATPRTQVTKFWGGLLTRVLRSWHDAVATDHVAAGALLRVFSIVLKPAEEGGFNVTVPALPEVATCGDRHAESLGNVREAIELTLGYRRDHGEPIPYDVPPTVEQVTVAA